MISHAKARLYKTAQTAEALSEIPAGAYVFVLLVHAGDEGCYFNVRDAANRVALDVHESKLKNFVL